MIHPAIVRRKELTIVGHFCVLLLGFGLGRRKRFVRCFEVMSFRSLAKHNEINVDA